MARRVVDDSTVEDFWQVGPGLSTFQLIGLTAGLPSPGTCLQPEGGSRLLAVQERNLPRLVRPPEQGGRPADPQHEEGGGGVEQQGGAGAQGEAGGHVVGVAPATNRRAGTRSVIII